MPVPKVSVLERVDCIPETLNRYVTLHFRDRRLGTASLRYRNRLEITVLMCEQKPYPVCGFCAGAKAFWYSVIEHRLNLPIIDSVSERCNFHNLTGFYLGFIFWGRSLEWPKATSFLGGSGGKPPQKFFKMNMH